MEIPQSSGKSEAIKEVTSRLTIDMSSEDKERGGKVVQLARKHPNQARRNRISACSVLVIYDKIDLVSIFIQLKK